MISYGKQKMQKYVFRKGVTMQRNARKCRKLSENHKIDVQKYLVHQQPFETASKKATFGAR